MAWGRRARQAWGGGGGGGGGGGSMLEEDFEVRGRPPARYPPPPLSRLQVVAPATPLPHPRRHGTRADASDTDGVMCVQRTLKVLVVGNGGVGKTSMIRRFCDGVRCP